MQKILLFLVIAAITVITFLGVSKTTNERINKLRAENELILKNNKVLDSVRLTYKAELDSKNLEIDRLQAADQLLIDHVKSIETKIKSLNTNYEKANSYSNHFSSSEITSYFADSLR